MKPTPPNVPQTLQPSIPGLQSSWQPAVYPMPAQAPAAPAGLDPRNVYSFGQGNGIHTPNAPLPQANGTHFAQQPQAPAAPGYIGPYSAQAYQMAGPRVGFMKPFDPLDPNYNPQPTVPQNPFYGGPRGSSGGWGALLRNNLGQSALRIIEAARNRNRAAGPTAGFSGGGSTRMNISANQY